MIKKGQAVRISLVANDWQHMAIEKVFCKLQRQSANVFPKKAKGKAGVLIGRAAQLIRLRYFPKVHDKAWLPAGLKT